MNKIFVGFLLFILIFEGLGFPQSHQSSPIILLLFSLLFLLILNIRKSIVIPKTISSIYLIFIFAGLLSLIQPINFFNALINFSLSISYFLVFLITYNLKRGLQKSFLNLFSLFAGIFVIYSIVVRNFVYPLWPNLVPETGYQLVFAKFGLHNHLGDFLTLAFIIWIYQILVKNGKIAFTYLIIFLPFFLFSYSRSAYISLIATSLIMTFTLWKSKRIVFSKTKTVFVSIFILSITFFGLLTTKEVRDLNFIKQITSPYFINNKILLSNRLEYLNQAIQGIKENPLTGVGGFNFKYISQKYTRYPGYSAESSHNLFLDIATEMGLLSLIFFIIFIFLVLKNSDKKNILFFVFLALLINFQTDYTHRIYVMMMLLFALAGIVYEEKNSSPR